MAKPILEFSILKLTDSISNNGQLLARHYSDGWILVQIVTFFPGNHQAFFHRAVDRLADFENKNEQSILKNMEPISIPTRHSRRPV